jgi:hypothetical protein
VRIATDPVAGSVASRRFRVLAGRRTTRQTIAEQAKRSKEFLPRPLPKKAGTLTRDPVSVQPGGFFAGGDFRHLDQPPRVGETPASPMDGPLDPLYCSVWVADKQYAGVPRVLDGFAIFPSVRSRCCFLMNSSAAESRLFSTASPYCTRCSFGKAVATSSCVLNPHAKSPQHRMTPTRPPKAPCTRAETESLRLRMPPSPPPAGEAAPGTARPARNGPPLPLKPSEPDRSTRYEKPTSLARWRGDGDYDVDCKVDGMGVMLKTKFLKKA